MKSVAELLARLKELNGELTAMKDKKDVADADKAAHLTSIRSKLAELEACEAELELAKSVEAAGARAAQPANQSVTVAAQPKKDLTAAEKIGIIMAGMVTALTEEGTKGFKPTMRALEERGYGELANEFAPAQKRALNSSNATAGGILLPENMSMDVIDLLRPNATFLQGGPQIIPMPNGTFKQPAAASGATAAYRGETNPMNVSQPTFKAINMSAKLLAGIVPLSNQLIRWSGPNIDAWARMDLSSAMGLKMDYMAYFGDGTQDTPLGIFNIPGVSVVDASASGVAPTYTVVDIWARSLKSPLESYGALVQKVAWIMAPRVKDYLADMRDGLGNLIYPGLSLEKPVWKGYPVLASTQVPITLGATTDQSYLALVAFGHVYFGDALRMQLAISDVATVVNGAQTINAFQDGVTLIRAEAEHDFDTRYAEAVRVLTGIRWGA